MKTYVGAVVLNETGDIYLIKEEDVNLIGRGRWNLPGGSSDDNESLIESTIRETKEETGYDVNIKSLLGCYKSFKGDNSWLYIVFEARTRGDQGNINDPSVKEGKWFTKVEFQKLTDMEIVHPDMKLVYELALSGKGLALDSVKFINYN